MLPRAASCTIFASLRACATARRCSTATQRHRRSCGSTGSRTGGRLSCREPAVTRQGTVRIVSDEEYLAAAHDGQRRPIPVPDHPGARRWKRRVRGALQGLHRRRQGVPDCPQQLGDREDREDPRRLLLIVADGACRRPVRRRRHHRDRRSQFSRPQSHHRAVPGAVLPAVARRAARSEHVRSRAGARSRVARAVVAGRRGARGGRDDRPAFAANV